MFFDQQLIQIGCPLHPLSFNEPVEFRKVHGLHRIIATPEFIRGNV